MVSMLSILPGTVPSDINGAFAVISLLSDDNKYRQRLAELQAMVDKADATINEANAALAKVEAEKANAASLFGQAQQAQAAAVAKEQAVTIATENVAKREADVTARDTAGQNDLAARKAEFEKYMADQRSQLTQASTALAEAKAAHAAKVAQDQSDSNSTAVSLAARASALAARADELDVEAKRLADMRADLESRLKKLAAIASGQM